MKHLSDHALLASFENLVKQEKYITAEVVAHLQEIGARKLYLQLGHKNLFTYLTKRLGYAPAPAQRRIDAARLLEAVPEVKNDLETGSLNLAQISVLAQGFRRKRGITAEEKRELVEKVKGTEVVTTQILVAKELDLPLMELEKTRHQKDESVRLEITLSKGQMEVLKRLREVLSHRYPNPTWAELFVLASKEVLKRKDPLTPHYFHVEVPERQSKASLRRKIFARDRSCQWTDPITGKKCESSFQLQIHHIQPRWAGGGNEPENLQLLCSAHHRLKHDKGN